MAVRGRKPKPSHLKLVTGNPGKRAINTQEPVPERILPQPPPELTAEARGEWDLVAGELNRLGLLTGIDRAALAAKPASYGADAAYLVKVLDRPA